MSTPPSAEHAAPWSAGSGPPRLRVPPRAVDCHFHVYSSRQPTVPGTPQHPDASVRDYQALQRRLGISRGVLVQPSAYGTDNSLHLEALRQLGTDDFRMVAVVAPDVSDSVLHDLHAAGVRGVRFNLTMPGVLRAADLAPLGGRLAELGWHCQVNASAAQLVEVADVLPHLPCRVVLDHMGHVPQPEGTASQGFAAVRRLLDNGRVWVKLSGAYIRSRTGAPSYADAGKVAAALCRFAPDRVLWGSDWPHPTQAAGNKPDDATLLDLLGQWTGTEEGLRKALVENPAALYGFPDP